MGKASGSGEAWLFGLDGEWFKCGMELHENSNALWLGATPKNKAGMSGSPIVTENGDAIGVFVIGTQSRTADGVVTPQKSGPHPVLANHLPGWLARKSRRSRQV